MKTRNVIGCNLANEICTKWANEIKSMLNFLQYYSPALVIYLEMLDLPGLMIEKQLRGEKSDLIIA